MTGFDRKPLGEVLGERGYIRGPFGSALLRRDLQDHGIPVYEQQHAITGTRQFRFFVDEEKFKEMSRFQVKTDDLIISCSGTIGGISVIQPDDRMGIISQALLILRPQTEQVLPEFLFYFLSTPEGQYAITQASHGSVQVNIAPRAVVERIEIPVPPLPEQRAIAHILGTLDDKIELNRRMNETLEAIARALFKSWFVDFDPVRAKVEGRDPGLPPHLADIFPDRFEESELGEIPKGWKVDPLGNHIDVVKGLSYKGSGLSASGMPLHNLNSIYEGGGYKYDGIKYYQGAFADRHVVHPGDLIVANTEQGHHHLLIGYAAIVPGLLGDRGAISHHIYRLDLLNSSPLSRSFIYHLINSGRMHQVISGYSNGTSINMLPATGLQKPKFVVPHHELIKLFSGLADTVLKKCEASIVQNQTIAALRDTMLPKLISGEIRLKDAERFVEGAAV